MTKTKEEVLRALAKSGHFNRNWLYREADKWGVDYDKIHGRDDGEPPKKYDFTSKEEEDVFNEVIR